MVAVKGGTRPPWVGLGAIVWVERALGNAYTFPLYSHNLKSVMGLSQHQLTMIGVANDIGKNVGLLPGLACDKFPPWVFLSERRRLIGLICFSEIGRRRRRLGDPRCSYRLLPVIGDYRVRRFSPAALTGDPRYSYRRLDLGDLLRSSESEVTGFDFIPFWGSLAMVEGDLVALAVVVQWANSSSSSSSSL
ncbi:hypothetical protein FH972_013371 [Carpinus fangiana]|uniref:Nodulin-like domain-containing protein n=1 Tax=Carpinus fangiana TaxID=176857 RepID=A0A5N6R6T2_9ROSI|nr:hypothetical protein FH972_013371 [Carpinus fangiana]